MEAAERASSRLGDCSALEVAGVAVSVSAWWPDSGLLLRLNLKRE